MFDKIDKEYLYIIHIIKNILWKLHYPPLPLKAVSALEEEGKGSEVKMNEIWFIRKGVMINESD